MVDGTPDQQAFPDRVGVVGGRPFLGDILGSEVVLARLQSLDHDVSVAIVVVPDAIEIVTAHVHRQFLPPIIRHALVHDRPPRIDRRKPVRPAA